MKNLRPGLLACVSLFVLSGVQADTATIKISNLKQGQTVSNPVEICMEASGVVIEAAKNGVNPGHGHMHILVDYPLPADLHKPLPFNVPEQVIHLGDGSHCRTLTLAPGKHSIRALVADGKHTPGEPPVTSVIEITVQ